MLLCWPSSRTSNWSALTDTQPFDRTKHKVGIVLKNLDMQAIPCDRNLKMLPNAPQGSPTLLMCFFPVFLIKRRNFQLYDLGYFDGLQIHIRDTF